jgi:cell division protein WhiA
MQGVLWVSFSRQVKQELSRRDDKHDCCGAWELTAFLLLRGYLSIREGTQTLIIQVDYNSIARHLFSLLKAAGIESPVVIRQQEQRLGKNSYLVQVTGTEQIEALLIYLRLKESGQANHLSRDSHFAPHKRCCRRAFIRGAFMAAGSISVSGRSGYHMEINCSYQEDAAALQKYLDSFSIKSFLRRHRDSYSVYLKDAEAIADFLRIIDASSAVLYLENIRVVKSMRNQVNRLVNCDTANLQKTVNSAQQQLKQIERIETCIGLDNLPPSLSQAARLRRRHPEASLKELGMLLSPPVGKSGMNHRFRQLERIAGECDIRGGKNIRSGE